VTICARPWLMQIRIEVRERGAVASWTSSTVMMSLSRVPFGRLLEAVINRLTMTVKARLEMEEAGRK